MTHALTEVKATKAPKLIIETTKLSGIMREMSENVATQISAKWGVWNLG